MPNAVEVAGLRKAYGEKHAVDGLDLHVAHGEVVAILGPNGAGKTTTVEILEGYRSRDAGDVRVLGQDPQTGDRAWRSRLGIVLQTNNDLAEATVAELVHHFARFFPDPRDPDEVIDSVGPAGEGDGRARGSCPAGSGDGSTWPWASSAGRSCCSSTSRRPGSTRRPGARSGTWSRRSPPTARRSCSRRTTWRRPSASPTGCSWSATVRSSPRGPPADLGGRTARQAVVRWTQDGQTREVRTDTPTQVVVELTGTLGGRSPGCRCCARRSRTCT